MSGENHNPLEFVRNMWGSFGASLPGMVAPTFDIEELDKRITDLKAVEGWLRMNLSMLQMTTQGLEMQKATLSAVKALGQVGRDQGTAAPASAADTFSQAAMWPWNMMQQIQEQLQGMHESGGKDGKKRSPAAAKQG